MSVEGFVEQLAQQSPAACLWAVDEFGDLLVEIHKRDHLAGLRGLLLTVYGGESHKYSRVSKGKGKNREKDDVVITDPHFMVVGCVTPEIFDKLLENAVTSGLLPRFAIVMPTGKPARLPFFELGKTSVGPIDDLDAVPAAKLKHRLSNSLPAGGRGLCTTHATE